jgi:hypothetical protein
LHFYEKMFREWCTRVYLSHFSFFCAQLLNPPMIVGFLS